MKPPETIDTPAAAAAHFRSGRTPIHYICATPWNLLGMRHWMEDLHFLCIADLCDGHLPRIAYPAGIVPTEGATFERLNDQILEDPGVLRYIEQQGPGARALFLMFDERNEAEAQRAGLLPCLPSAALRDRLDDKLVTTRLGDQIGVRSVPNVLARVDSYATLRRCAHSLGPELVIQLPFGDSGRSTFFVASEEDYARHAAEIEAAAEVKVMRRIRCRQAAIEACVTRQGIVIGPLATELIGFPELTPFAGGWCGNEIAAGAFSGAILDEAASITRRIGQQLERAGYLGVFGLDFLIDEDSGDIYLGELNPRITGLTPVTTQAARDLDCAPLMLFHILEWLDLPHQLDVEEASERFRRLDGAQNWSQLIVKETRPDARPVERVPPSGIWSLPSSGPADLVRVSFDTGDIRNDREALVVRTVGPGYPRSCGTPIVRVLTLGRVMTDEHKLEPRALSWIASVRAQF